MDRSDRIYWIIICAVGTVVAALVGLTAWTAESTQASGGDAPSKPGARSAAPPQRSSAPRSPGSRFSLSAVLKRHEVFARARGDKAFARLAEPRPGQWLWHFREPGQTVGDHRHTATNLRSRGRKTLHLQPYSDLDARQRGVLQPLERFVATYFQAGVVRLRRAHTREAWWSAGREQYRADRIIGHLANSVPRHSLGLFGLVGRDMYSGDLNFVFGLALLHRRASVHSLHRYDGTHQQLLLRSLKLSAHELGHLFGIRHCVFYRCVMNGTNSLHESDGAPLHLCPACLAKLRWSLCFDPVVRYRELASFYRHHGLTEQARFVTDRAAQLLARGPVEPASVACAAGTR